MDILNRALALGAVLIILNSCATTKLYEKKLQSWVGSSESELVNSWGPPSSVYDLPDGGKMITYGKEDDKIHYEKYCRTTWTLNSLGFVTKWQYWGNYCKSKD